MFGKQSKSSSSFFNKILIVIRFSNVKDLITSRTAKDTLILLIGSIISTLSGFIITLVMARKFSTTEFGIFVTAISFTQLLTELSDLGLSSAGTKYISSLNKEEQLKAIKSTLVLRTLSALVISGLVFITSYLIAIIIFRNLDILYFLQLSSLGIFFQLILSWGQVLYQSQRKFIISALTTNSVNILRLIVVIILLIFVSAKIEQLYLGFQLVLVIPVIFILKHVRKNIATISISFIEYKRIIRFALSLGVSAAVVALYTRLDQIMVFNIAGSSEAGIYGLSSRISSFFLFTSHALNSVVIPRFAILDKTRFHEYFKKVLYASIAICSLDVLGILLAPKFIPLLFGLKFTNSVLPFQILAVAAIFYVFLLNVNSAMIFYFKANNFILYNSLLSFILIVILLYALVPSFKSEGAALAVLITYGVQMIVASIYFRILKSKNS